VSRSRFVGGFVLGVLGTAALSAGLFLTPDLHGLPTESLLMMALVVATALVGGLWPAIVAALLGSVSLNFLFVPPTGTFAISDPQNAIALAVFLITGIAVASVVDLSARRSEQAIRARAEANALAVLSHTLLHIGENPVELLEQAGQVFGMSGAAVLRTSGPISDSPEPAGTEPAGLVAQWGQPISSVDQADAVAEIEPGLVLALRGHPLEAADRGLLTAYAAHLAVIADRRRAASASRRASELAEGNRTRTALLAAVSHDLRSPLAAIKAAISSLRSDVAFSPEDEEELLATVEESADRLDNLIGNLLDMSRLQTGAINPLLTDLDLASAVFTALAPLPGAASVEVCLEPDLPPALADPGLLDRVIANLAENALKHTPPGTKVSITGSRWRDPGGRAWVSLRVVDHGPGVAAESRAAMFAPFQRLGDVPQGDGLGLGLAVARGLAEAMSGTVSAEDTPGGGLTMVIDLPASDDADPNRVA
jgi:two-component system, OmpR family, sensor histidine kinase KdpD